MCGLQVNHSPEDITVVTDLKEAVKRLDTWDKEGALSVAEVSASVRAWAKVTRANALQV